MNIQREYKTKDFYSAVILKVLGWLLVDVDRVEGKFCMFVFEDPENGAEDCIRKYWNRELSVDPRLMVETIGELKTRIYSVI
jgi:hypothetical protein